MNTPKLKKMYVLVRSDLNTVYSCVQGGHALAQFSLQFRDIFETWNNRTIVYLKVRNEDALKFYVSKLKNKQIDYSVFHEPDLHNQMTAIACYCDGKIFSNLPCA